MTAVEEGSVPRRDFYLTTHNSRKRQTFIPPAEFEPAIPASERLQTYALNGAATEIGAIIILVFGFYTRLFGREMKPWSRLLL
jgi:hypothetical protein